MNPKLFVKKHSTTIFNVGAGVLGLSAVASGIIATPRALELIKKEEEEKGEKLTKKEILKTAWKPYIPTAFLVLAEAGCLVGSSTSSASAIANATAAVIAERKTFQRYLGAVEKIAGPEVLQEAKKEVNIEKAKEVSPEYAFQTTGGQDLFFDPYNGRYFYSSTSAVIHSVDFIVPIIKKQDFCSHNDFCYALGLPESRSSGEIGWNIDDIDIRYFEVDLIPGQTEDKKLFHVVDFTYKPMRMFDREAECSYRGY